MSAKTKSTLNMTEGNILRIILIFAFPILIGNIFQQLYNIVDTAVIGYILGDDSLAAVGATAPLYSLVIGLATGFTNGFSVVIARYFGANDEVKTRKAVTLTLLLTLAVSVVVTIVSVIGLSPLMKLLDTPDNILDEASGYLRIILIFSVVTMLYNMFAGMLRAIGNSKAPLYFLVVSTIVNIVLDIIFIKYFELGVAGAAYATIIAQIVSVLLCIVYIVKKCPLLKIDYGYISRDIIKDKEIISELFMTGFSMALMFTVVSIGSVALQSAVNGFGTKTIAAHIAARKIDDIFMLPLGTLSLSSATFASQNYGAGRIDRVKKGITTSMLIAFVWSAISIVAVYLFGGFMVKTLIGTSEQVIIDTAVKYIRINIPFFLILSVLLVLRSSLQGVGRKLFPLIASGIELVLKFAAVGFVTPVLGYLGVCILEPTCWILCAVLVFVDFMRFYRQGLARD